MFLYSTVSTLKPEIERERERKREITMFSAKKKKKRVLLLFDKKYSRASSSSFLFWDKKSLQQNVCWKKNESVPPLFFPKRVDTSQKDAQKITHPDDDDDDDDGVRGVL